MLSYNTPMGMASRPRVMVPMSTGLGARVRVSMGRAPCTGLEFLWVSDLELGLSFSSCSTSFLAFPKTSGARFFQAAPIGILVDKLSPNMLSWLENRATYFGA